MSAWSSWSTWLALLINTIVPIISLQFLFQICTAILRNVDKYTITAASTVTQPNGNQTLCDRCKCIINKKTSPAKKTSSAQNYHNKEQQTNNNRDESFDQSYSNESDADNQLYNVSSSDDDHNIVGQVSTREVISYIGNDPISENNKILEVCRTKNTVSKLRKQFESGNKKKNRYNADKDVNRFFQKQASPTRSTPTNDDPAKENSDIPVVDKPKNDYFVIEKTKVYKVLNNNKENVKGAAVIGSSGSNGADKLSKILLSKRSHSNGDIKRNKKSSAHDIIVEESIFPNGRSSSTDHIDDEFADVEYRKLKAAGNRRSVRTFDDILEQERFSKCYSEYSISDLLNDLPDDDDDIEFTSFLNKIN